MAIYNPKKHAEIINKQLQEKDDQVIRERIENQAKDIQADLDTLKTKEEQQAYFVQMLKNKGIDEKVGIDAYKSLGTENFPISKIIPTMTMFFVTEELKKVQVDYQNFNRIILRQAWKNGSKVKDYLDYTDVDETSAYSDVVIGDFNGENPPLGRELWVTTYEFHKKMRVLMGILNDISKTASLFLAWLNDYDLQVARPMAKRVYQMNLQHLADPSMSDDYVSAGIDANGYTIDQTITGDLPSVTIGLKNYLQGLRYASRNHTKSTFWIPAGLTQQLERKLSREDFVIMWPKELFNETTVRLLANTFNMEEVDMRKNIMVMDYDKTFIEYGKVTGLMHGENNTYDIYMYQPGVIELGEHYRLDTNTNTPKAYSINHSYARMGYGVNKNKLIIKLRLVITPPTTTTTSALQFGLNQALGSSMINAQAESEDVKQPTTETQQSFEEFIRETKKELYEEIIQELENKNKGKGKGKGKGKDEEPKEETNTKVESDPKEETKVETNESTNTNN